LKRDNFLNGLKEKLQYKNNSKTHFAKGYDGARSSAGQEKRLSSGPEPFENLFRRDTDIMRLIKKVKTSSTDGNNE
jgi:hypothetical protein